jgi:hypothetical protein
VENVFHCLSEGEGVHDEGEKARVGILIFVNCFAESLVNLLHTLHCFLLSVLDVRLSKLPQESTSGNEMNEWVHRGGRLVQGFG